MCAAYSSDIFLQESTIGPQRKMKVTVIPGDGVGLELTHAVQHIVRSTGIPLEFEEVCLRFLYFEFVKLLR